MSFAPVARQGAHERVAVGEIVAGVVEVEPVAVAGHGDIGGVTVHAGRGQHVGAVHGHALRLVDGGGVAVVKVGVVLQVEGDAAAIGQPDGQAL